MQFSPAAGRAGRCRQTSLCVGSIRRAPAILGLPRTGVSVLSPSTLLRLPAALYGAGPMLSAVPVFGSSTKARIWLRLRFVPSPAWAARAARGLGALSPGAARLFPPRPQRAQVGCLRLVFVLRSWPLAVTLPAAMSTIQNLRKSLDRTRGLFAGREGVASLGLSLPLAPPPASYLQRGWAALLWSFSVPLFCEPPAVCSGRSIFPSLSHSLKKLPPTALRAFGPVPTLSNAARSVPPPLAGGGCGRLGYFSAGSCF